MYNHLSPMYREQRVRSFRKRKGISTENRAQGLIMALAITLLVIVGWQYLGAQRDLSTARADYASVTESN